MARMAPAATNSQGIAYIIIEDKKLMETASVVIADWLETTPLGQTYFKEMLKAYQVDKIDTILHGAPASYSGDC